jgi:hypothetical protein
MYGLDFPNRSRDSWKVSCTWAVPPRRLLPPPRAAAPACRIVAREGGDSRAHGVVERKARLADRKCTRLGHGRRVSGTFHPLQFSGRPAAPPSSCRPACRALRATFCVENARRQEPDPWKFVPHWTVRPQTTKELCDVLVQRQLGNPLFLSRNFLCTRRVSPSGQDGGRALPYVHYTCGHKAVDWSADVSGLGCLWCQGQPQVRFTRERDLMQHLRACHGQFRYVLDDSSLSAAGGAGVVVEVRLRRALCSKPPAPSLHAWPG